MTGRRRHSDQRDLFSKLPGVTATRESVLDAKWATVAFLRRELGYELPSD